VANPISGLRNHLATNCRRPAVLAHSRGKAVSRISCNPHGRASWQKTGPRSPGRSGDCRAEWAAPLCASNAGAFPEHQHGPLQFRLPARPGPMKSRNGGVRSLGVPFRPGPHRFFFFPTTLIREEPRKKVGQFLLPVCTGNIRNQFVSIRSAAGAQAIWQKSEFPPRVHPLPRQPARPRFRNTPPLYNFQIHRPRPGLHGRPANLFLIRNKGTAQG